MIKSHHIKREFLTYFCRLVVSKQTFKIWVSGPKNSWNWRKIVFNSLLKGRLVVRYYSCAIPFIWTHFHKFQLQKGIKQCGKRMTFKRWQKKISKTSKSKQARESKILQFQKRALQEYGLKKQRMFLVFWFFDFLCKLRFWRQGGAEQRMTDFSWSWSWYWLLEILLF